MNKIKSFISKLLKGYFNEEDKKELIDMLTVSLEEKVDDLVEQGTPRNEAIERSIQEFGDTEDVLNAFPNGKQKATLIHKRKSQVFYSIFGYIIIVGLAIFINFTFFEVFGNILWFVIVCLGLLFWPITMLYRYLLIKK
ncbi:MAG TPA: permease prefix domain 1-containing protein [Candidatus Izemoplasmatales bacterium]|nr:permease prefix domain 1-containing protein [Candidatus Izemoplasmatales bacterium]